MSFLKQLWEKRIIRFLAVGGFNTIFDISLLLLFFKVIGLPEIVANTISVSISVSVSYVLNHAVVFRHKDNYSLKNYLHFFTITGFSIIFIQDLTIYLVTQRLWVLSANSTVTILNLTIPAKTMELLASKIAAVLIGMVWNYLFYKYVVFRDKNTADIADELTIA